MNRYSLSEESINKVLKYLGERPYTEVSHLIAILRQDALQIIEPQVEEESGLEKDGGE